MTEARLIHVLLAEDDPRDIELTREALDDAHVAIDLAIVEDGERCLRYLRGEGEYGSATRPDIVFLDLRMPKKDGLEVLSEMKDDEVLATIPVVILTSSKAEEDIAKAYAKQASAYVIKPVGFAAFQEVVKVLDSFWFGVVTLPPREAV